MALACRWLAACWLAALYCEVAARKGNYYETPTFLAPGLPPLYGVGPATLKEQKLHGLGGKPGVDGASTTPERWIFWFKSGANASQVETVCVAGALYPCYKYQRAINGASAQMTIDDLKVYLGTHGALVQSVYLDGKVQGLGFASSIVDHHVPWHLDRIDQPDPLLDDYFAYPCMGTGVSIYVVDTGIRASHSDFKYIDGTEGIAAGLHNGVAKNSSVWDIRVLDCNKSALLSDTIASLDWIVQNHVEPAVAVLSLGGPANALLDAAVESMYNEGIPTITAGGNNHEDACSWSPARTEFCLTVGASTPADQPYSTSNFGKCIDLYAPGQTILSASHLDEDDGVYQSGTSMSAPMVAGAALMYLQIHPTASPAEVMNAIMDTSIKDALNNLHHESPNALLNVAQLVKQVDIEPEEVALVYEEDIIQDAPFNLSLTSAPPSDVHIDLTLSDPLVGVINPTSVTFGPTNWSNPALVSFIPKASRFPFGRAIVVTAALDDGSGNRLRQGLRLVDSNFSKPGDTISNAITIRGLPYQEVMNSAEYSGSLHGQCHGLPLEAWSSPEIVFEFIPSQDATITVDMCDSHVPTKLIVLKGAIFDAEHTIVNMCGVENCGFGSQMSRATFHIDSGGKYNIIADGVNGSAGIFDIKIRETNGRVIPAILPSSDPSSDASSHTNGGGPEGSDAPNSDKQEEEEEEENDPVQALVKLNVLGVSIAISSMELIIGGSSLGIAFLACWCCCWCWNESKKTEEFQAMKDSKKIMEKLQHGRATIMATRTNMGKTVKNVVTTVAKTPGSAAAASEKLTRGLKAVHVMVRARMASQNPQPPSAEIGSRNPMRSYRNQDKRYENTAESLLNFARGKKDPTELSREHVERTGGSSSTGAIAKIKGMVKFLGAKKGSKTAPAPEIEAIQKQNKDVSSLFLSPKQRKKDAETSIRMIGGQLLRQGRGKVQQEPNTIFHGPPEKQNNLSCPGSKPSSDKTPKCGSVLYPKVAAVWSSISSPSPSSEAEEAVDFSSLSTLNEAL